MTYKGYIGAVEYDDNAKTFSGRVINANVLVSFRGDSVQELEASLRNVVDAYLEDCQEGGVEPEKPYNGTLTVRVDPGVHRMVAQKAAQKNLSMNRYVEGLLRSDVEDQTPAGGARPASSAVATRARVGARAKKPARVTRKGQKKKRPLRDQAEH